MTTNLVSRKHTYKNTQRPSMYPQKKFKAKPCKWCGYIFNPTGPSNHYCCKECQLESRREAYYVDTYGMTLAQVSEMKEKQGNKCAICQRHPATNAVFCVDHSHETGKVRGLLCQDCNRALGLLRDNPDSFRRAAEYLERSTTIPKGSTSEANAGGNGVHTKYGDIV